MGRAWGGVRPTGELKGNGDHRRVNGSNPRLLPQASWPGYTQVIIASDVPVHEGLRLNA